MISNIIDYIKEQKSKIASNGGVESAAIFYLEKKYFNKVEDFQKNQDFQDEAKLAVFGYTDNSDIENDEAKELLKTILGKQEIKPGMHYSSNPLLLVGIILAAKKIKDDTSLKLLNKMAEDKVISFDLFEQFIIYSSSDIKPLSLTIEDISIKNISYLLGLYSLKKEFPQTVSIEEKTLEDLIIKKIGGILTKTLDYKEIFLFDYFLQTATKQAFIYKNQDARFVIKTILLNFNDAVEKIKGTRRKDHSSFEINDEYDVQDLLYVILKPLFSDLTPEDYVIKHAGSNKRIDLVIPSENIVIEVKIIRQTDNVGKFIEELNVDISSYYKHPSTRVLFGFIYDPFHKVTDLHPFNQLNGKRSHDEIRYEVDIVINPH